MAKLRYLGVLLLPTLFLFVLALRGQTSQPPSPGAGKEFSQNRSTQSHPEHSNSNPSLQFAKSLPSGIAVAQTTPDQPKPQPDEYKVKDGSAAEWRSDPNSWVAIFTLLLVAVAAIQAGLFFWQLGMLKESLTDSKNAADAAKVASEAAKASADIATTSERAWVVDEIRQIDNLPNPDVFFAVYLTFKNFGRVPALVMGLKIRFHTFRLAETDPLVGGEPMPEFPVYDDEQIFLEIGDRGVMLAPGQSLTIAQLFEEEGGKWTKFLEIIVPTKQRHLCCYGVLSYMDGFGSLRMNQFCYIWDKGFDPAGVIPNFRRFGPVNYNHAD
jgi:hypothetical protein